MSLWSDPSRRRWLVWGALAVAFLLVSLYRLSTAVLADELMRAFDTTGASLGTLHAAFFYIYAALQLPSGVLVDRVGIRKTATLAVLIMSVGALAFSVADTYLLAFASRALLGFGASVIYISILRFVANWFRPTEFATMNGLTVGVSGLGGILATTPLAVAVATVGWRETIIFLGLLGFALAVAIYVFARDTPKQAALDPIDGVPSSPSLSLADVTTNLKGVLGERETWLAGTLLFCIVGINITLLGLWGVPFVVQQYDVSVTEASTYTLLGSVGLVLGPPVFGWISDRLENRTAILVIATLVYTAVVGGVVLTGTPPLFYVAFMFFLIGFLMGGTALAYTVIKERHDSAASGVSTGTVNTIAYTGAALFPTVLGVALDVYWTGETVAGSRIYTDVGYRVAFAIATMAGVVALVCALSLHVRTHGWSSLTPS
ncbi:MFS transporter [Haladaptatus sp. DJG-WS-42]|uniref:MFS transporter n=1 Tax=Haladaptatus sp. DJG-WS-42 TaxID=3120516 RepID=UPI0030D0AD0D